MNRTRLQVVALRAYTTRARGFLATLSAAFIFCVSASIAEAGFLVGNNPGAMGGNDTLAKVLEEIDEYNTANDPDLIDPTALFKKTDDDATFVFNMANGFMFFEDAAGTMPVTTESALTNLDEAYFKYTGSDANVLYYSVKGPSQFGFSLFTFMSGLNFLDLDGDSRNMSHVSFWEGPPGTDPFGNPTVPEPSALVLLLSMGTLLTTSRRRYN
ncbi:PEP-CTERM sorting domain-containing protein [Adhaeretor mobilis]|uniref:PEP-CTERM protein-sorting domain-containing protein n=1 Tax=Adhaeretor mobilis TaxID=1930276 RepID=A0A517N2D9_9BACT|nr:PEP-CTERM sorting domain-containing protein [Adhaeretor mobilis]QDT01309.1 hypothetical protein HG15A2_46510 [Adhaeretor mobilis]